MRKIMTRGLFKSATLGGVLAASAAVALWQAQSAPTRAQWLVRAGLSTQCPAGFHLERERGERECARLGGPEPLSEFEGLRHARSAPVAAPHRAMPLPGAYRAAVRQRQAMLPLQASVANAGSAWAPYGSGPLLVNDPRYGSVAGEGYIFNSGRIDSLDYDPVGQRVFATLGTGGVWMSTDLGEHWTSVGESLPSQVVGSVAWSSFGGTGGSGGTLIVAAGDPSFGGDDYAGLGAFWSSDLGQTWHFANGVPDGVLGFKAAVDHAHPSIAYVATSKGLFRSTDGGRNYVNVVLPTSDECKGVTDYTGKCQFANFVTDVIVKEPGGSTSETGGQVLAAVGYRAGAKALPDGSISSPGNGLYASADGSPGSFTKLNVATANTLSPLGFATQERTGRIAFGPAVGADQDHNYVYAMVEDAVLFNGGFQTIDLPESLANPSPLGNPTLFNGLYVSPDFGQTWTRMADTVEIAENPLSGSALVATGAVQSYLPGVQAYYNLWVKPDPTSTAGSANPGVPSRLAFGLEEVWTNILPVAQNGTLQTGPSDYKVVGVYRTGTAVPTAVTGGTTTHPDQHAGIWIPDVDGAGGVTLIVGNDGGAYRQHIDAGGKLSQGGWGDGADNGFNTLLPYGIGVANDGVVWFGLQDNGSGKVDTDGKYYETYGGDGFFVAVDPNDSNTAWEEYTQADMRYTTDGGQNWTGNAPTLTGANFANPFVMDPSDANHLLTAANEVVELTGGVSGSWIQVFTLGTNADNGQNNIMSAVDLVGDNAYVGFCGICDLLNRTQYQFHSGLATNVGGTVPPRRGSGDGWHFAAAKGLPNRYITAIAIDPAQPKTVYVALGGYANRQWVPPGSFLDTNPDIGVGHVFKSVDAGENFSDISGNLPDAHATTIKVRKGQILVGMDVGAFISSDVNGSTWAPLGTGLPNVPVAQFQLKPDDDSQLFVATFGRGIYRTVLGSTGGSSSSSSSGGGSSSSSSGSSGGSSSGSSGSSSSSSGGGSSSGSSSGGTSGGSSSSSSSSSGSSSSGSSSGGTTQPPHAALQASPVTGTAPLLVNFDASASSDPNSGGSLTAYAFDFGDGSSATVSTPHISHTYHNPGSYTATVTVTDSEGGSASASAVISAQSAQSDYPSASLAVSTTDGSVPLAVNFDASGSHDANGHITGYVFDFGDGSATVSQATPTTSHSYTAAGTYQASVTVSNSFGNSSAATVPIHVSTAVVVTPPNGPVAELVVSPTSGTAPLTVTLDGSHSFEQNSPAHITAYTFSFGDGSAAVTQSGSAINHVYTQAGTYTPSLTVTDSAGQHSAAAMATAHVAPASSGGSGGSGSSGNSGGGAFGATALLPLFLGAAWRRRRKR